MIAKYICKPLGVDSAPIGNLKKRFDALVGLYSTFVNGANQEDATSRNIEMQKETNKQNLDLARETNEMSRQQFQEYMKWLREQYYDTDQVARAKEAYYKAGLNPALAYGNPTAGGASSVGAPSPSQFHVAQMDAPHVEPFQIGDGLSQSVHFQDEAY